MVIRIHSGETKKVTMSLPAALLDEVRDLVDAGVAPSQSAFVAAALKKEVRAKRVAQLREEYRQAAVDPEFLRDLDAAMHEFLAADAEAWRMIP